MPDKKKKKKGERERERGAGKKARRGRLLQLLAMVTYAIGSQQLVLAQIFLPLLKSLSENKNSGRRATANATTEI